MKPHAVLPIAILMLGAFTSSSAIENDRQQMAGACKPAQKVGIPVTVK